MLKDFLKKIIRPSFRLKLKKSKRKLISFFINQDKVTLIDVKFLLVENFEIKKGDNLIITSSFGNLNAAFSPSELIDLLKELVGISGNIVMPFYPGNSYELLKNKTIFNMTSSLSAMGVVTQKFSESENVYKSKHPTKSVIAWGKNAKEIINGHELTETPFSYGSPYDWLYKNGSKSLGLGVKSTPMFHYCEDILYKNKLNLYLNPEKMSIVDYNGNLIKVETKVHNPKILNKLLEIGDYIYLNQPKSFKIKKLGFNHCYIVDNQNLYKFCEIEFHKNNFRYKR
jgi:aminoglycoside 3-N-acetyltransferase